MLKINENHLKKIKKIKNQFLSKTDVPKEDDWKNDTNNEIWWSIIGQVIVVGKDSPVDKFWSDNKLRNEVSYDNLIKIKDENEITKKINHALRAVGTRYASDDISKCKKTKSLVHNLKVLKNIKGGPKGLLQRLSELSGRNGDKRKIKYLMKIMFFIKSKGARDFLMGQGLVRNAVAFDVRVITILRKKVGIKIPGGYENDEKLYDNIEKDVLSKICNPLGISGVQFDRMLFQNYDKIMKMNFGQDGP